MSRLVKLVLVLIFPTMLIGIATAAMMADPNPDQLPRSNTAVSSQPTQPNSNQTEQILTINGSPNLIQDGGFEDGIPNNFWDEASSSFGTPICDASCVMTPTNYARNGTYWAWLGGDADESSSLTQTVTISNANFATLSFYLRVPVVNGSNGNDYLRVAVDGNTLFEVTDVAESATKYASYTLIEIDVTAYADGQAHEIRFYAEVHDGLDNFFVDDVSLSTFDQTYVYLPLAVNNYCVQPTYTEMIRYNISIIDAPAMWALAGNCTLGDGITVAVIDTGVDLDHPDLQANLVAGQTFVAGTTTPDDDQGHGSHVAGAVAAMMNDIGVIGVAPQAQIMPIKVLDQDGSGYVSDVAAGIRWAADNGAQVINLSLGGPSATSIEQDAINYATNKGVLVIAAAGNCGDPSTWQFNNCTSLDSIGYPAAFANAMAVASTNVLNQQSSFSTQGSYVEIAAPGSAIYSTVPGGSYGTKSGTSQATPHVAGLAAAIWSMNPSLSNVQIRAILNSTAVDLGSAGKDIQFGYGRIDAVAAATQAVNTSSLSNSTTTIQSTPQTIVPNLDAAYAPGQIILKFEEGVAAQSVTTLAEFDLGIASVDEVTITEYAEIDAYIVTVPVGEELVYLQALNGLDSVQYAELNYIVTIQ